MVAINLGHKEIAKLLVDRGADDKKGWLLHGKEPTTSTHFQHDIKDVREASRMRMCAHAREGKKERGVAIPSAEPAHASPCILLVRQKPS